MSVWLPKS